MLIGRIKILIFILLLTPLMMFSQKRDTTMFFSLTGDTIGFTYHLVENDTSYIYMQISRKIKNDSVARIVEKNLKNKKVDGIDSSEFYAHKYFKNYGLTFSAKKIDFKELIKKNTYSYKYHFKCLGKCHIADNPKDDVDSIFTVNGVVSMKNNRKIIHIPYNTMLEGGISDIQKHQAFFGISIWYCQDNNRYYISMSMMFEKIPNGCKKIYTEYKYLDILI